MNDSLMRVPFDSTESLSSRIKRGSAFTLVELLVVIAIIGVLVSLLLPAVQAARESARRTSCLNNLMQLSLALSNYHLAHTHLPAGTVNDKGPIVHTPVGFHHSWIVQILPMLDQAVVHQNMKHDQSIYSAANARIRAHSVPILDCPSSYKSNDGLFSNYAAVHNSVETGIDVSNNGVFFLNSHLTYDDITDGLSYTLAVGEKDVDVADLGWSSGTRATLRNLGTPLNNDRNQSMTLGISYPVGIVFADSQGKFLDNDMDGVPDDLSEPVAGLRVSQGNTGYGMLSGDEVLTEESLQANGWTVLPGDPANWLPVSMLPTVIPGRPNTGSDVGGFSSWHTGMINFASADGAVKSISQAVDRATLLRMANRHDGQLTKSLDEL